MKYQSLNCVTYEQNHSYESFIKVGIWAVKLNRSARAVLSLIPE